MPVRSSTVPTVRAATLGPEQHGTVRPPAIDTMLGPQPGLSSLWQDRSQTLWPEPPRVQDQAGTGTCVSNIAEELLAPLARGADLGTQAHC